VNKIRQNDLGEEKILFFTALKDLVGFAEVEKIRERRVVLRNIRKNFPKPSFNPQYIVSNRKKKKIEITKTRTKFTKYRRLPLL